MARYIDADTLSTYFDALAKHAEMEGLHNQAHLYRRCLQLVDNAPTADVVEVVRCKDCKHIASTEYGGFCCLKDEGVAYNDFCGYGEGKDNKQREVVGE
jgi:hypothetical protein